LKFVKALKSQGKIVAVTGDSPNDAPCFLVSDVSFTMGKSGTEIVKESGDIVLLDDSYASIVNSW
jgi:cation transport ATPase